MQHHMLIFLLLLFPFQINSLASKGEYKPSGQADQASKQSLFTASYVY